MKDKIKVYQFFIVGDTLDNRVSPTIQLDKVFYSNELSKEYSLYAYTLSPALAKVFRECRRDDLFYEKVIKVTKDELAEIVDKYSECCLHDAVFNTKDYDDRGFVMCKEVNVTVTVAESNHILKFDDRTTISHIIVKEPNFKDYMNIIFELAKSNNPEIEYIFNNIFPVSILSEVHQLVELSMGPEIYNSDLIGKLIDSNYPMDIGGSEDFKVDYLRLYFDKFSSLYKSGGDLPCYMSSIDYLQIKTT